MSYPPTHSECQQLFDELKHLDATSGPEFNARKYAIIHDLAEAQFYGAVTYFIAGLDNPDPDYRTACISALVTHWRKRDDRIVAKLLDMAANDPDAQVRFMAIDSLGILELREALPTLNRIVENSEEEMWLREAANRAVRQMTGHPNEDILKQRRQAECDELWEQLRRIDAAPEGTGNPRKYEIISDMAERRCDEAKSYIIAGLSNSDPDYRMACISALTILQRWREEDRTRVDPSSARPDLLPRGERQAEDVQIASKLLDMTRHDPDERVRERAFFVLGTGTFKVEEILPFLRHIVENYSKYPSLWKTAYLSILIILNRPREEILTLGADFGPAMINQELLRTIPDTLGQGDPR